jgi:DNA-binding winged helix-turn-helix (wHTH) protein
MAPDLKLSYEFGEFILVPSDHLLLYNHQPLNLFSRDFDILSYLVQHPKTLVRTADLIEAVWGEGTKLSDGNITTHVAQIRKAIGCNARNPRFIKTIHGKKGYRFIAEVEQKELDGEIIAVSLADEPSLSNSAYEITAHLFVPMYLGKRVFQHIRGMESDGQWAQYKVFQIEQGRLCILPSGFGVWHLTKSQNFQNLREFAEWRKKEYNDILNREHVIEICMRELTSPLSGKSGLDEKIGVPGYAFSAVVLNRAPQMRSQETIRHTLEVLSCPISLEPKRDIKNDSLVRLERELLNYGIKSGNIEEFGLTGLDIGFASWDAVSYFQISKEKGSLEADLIEFQIAVQSLWWMSKCFSEIALSGERKQIETVRKYIREVKRQFSRIKNIAASDSPSLRTMIEAVLNTSRIRQIVEETLELFGESGD